MSRSKHTDPLAIRAERRMRSPWEKRGTGDLSRRARLGRTLKKKGIIQKTSDPQIPREPFQPRVVVQNPRPGYFHPANKTDLLQLLNFVGAEAKYGLQSIQLAQLPETMKLGIPLLGRLIIPGQIMLYEQPIPPWHLSGRLSTNDAHCLVQAGALLKFHKEIFVTTVNWPEHTLRNFMLFEAFMHEIGHHILQHHQGKRIQRIARTRDHEAFADKFAKQCRMRWLNQKAMNS